MQTKTNILVLTEIYPTIGNEVSGAFCKEQSLVLSSKYNVTVLCFRVNYARKSILPRYSFLRNYIDDNLEEYILDVEKSIPGYNQLNFLLTSYKFVINTICANKKFDIIHAHFSYPAGILAKLLSDKLHIPYIITEHASNFKGLFRTPIHRLLVFYALKNASRVVAVGPSLKAEILKYINIPVEIIPNVVDETKFNLKKNKTEKIKRIGFIGFLEDNRKGLDLLLVAFSKLNSQDITLEIIGSGKMLEHYKSQAQSLKIYERCNFIGALPPENIPDFFSTIDLFVLPSRKESFGVVVIESMASGVPVIATRCGGPENLISKQTGLVIDKDNVDALFDAMVYLIENVQLYNSEDIRQYVIKNFGKQAFLNNFSQLIDEFISKKL